MTTNKKPETWAVKRDEAHPLWRVFMAKMYTEAIFTWTLKFREYIGMGSYKTIDDIPEHCTILTLDEWAHYHLTNHELEQEGYSLDKWIPLHTGNDIIPELCDDNVLVLYENGSRETVHIEDFFGDITNGFDEDCNQMYTKWYLNHKPKVTHWQPLPAPPNNK